MSAATRMPSGPQRKSAVWRAGAWFLGAALLLELAGTLFGMGFVAPVWFAVFVILGVTLSTHYGVPWLRNEEPPGRSEPKRMESVHVSGGGPGATYVLVHDPSARGGAGGGPGKAPKVKELSPFWYVLWVVFWKAPLFTGDMVLSLVYQAIARASGRRERTSLSDMVGESGSDAAWEAELRRNPSGPQDW
jgi:hypothetical protein